ncbi:hypothetical protein [Cardinium endosymbiont of Culicoides punctatus]|uniref:hypothetical protein n=1 Tax=Cardinium endosymbiont of Culicoides punctatus TaxID=2304601 RepID=UPI00105886AC|nr:hypothetical protein [Cardinium endosymbiont of Culicoides punctatus]TDG94585.1 hypothetical protein CCPUN_07770 [Cardinium endosymbiont of Culicoides punctatus]
MYTPIEQALTTIKPKQQQLTFKWTSSSCNDLLFFIDRYKVSGKEAKPLGAILRKIRSLLSDNKSKNDLKKTDISENSIVKLHVGLTYTDAITIHNVFRQIELESSEIPSYLAIFEPVDKIVISESKRENSNPEATFTLSLSQEDIENIFIFFGRYTLIGEEAIALDAFFQKIRTVLPKESSFSSVPELPSSPKTSIKLNRQEVSILHIILNQIPIRVTELTPFLAIYKPIAEGSHSTSVHIELEFTQDSYHNLSLFMRRFTLSGKMVHQYNQLLQQIESRIVK